MHPSMHRSHSKLAMMSLLSGVAKHGAVPLSIQAMHQVCMGHLASPLNIPIPQPPTNRGNPVPPQEPTLQANPPPPWHHQQSHPNIPLQSMTDPAHRIITGKSPILHDGLNVGEIKWAALSRTQFWWSKCEGGLNEPHCTSETMKIKGIWQDLSINVNYWTFALASLDRQTDKDHTKTWLFRIPLTPYSLSTFNVRMRGH